MDQLLFGLGLTVAVVAAVRGVWSPCGLSMLSSITPMTEAGRGASFRHTARFFLVGGLFGGLSLGAVAALGAWAVDALAWSTEARWGLAACLGLVTASIDLGLFGDRLPIFKRQVNDAWLRTYRPWVYGAGFGWQIGAGVTTYIMTAGVFLTIGLAVLGASPVAALAIGAVFGLVRGSAVYVGRTATSPAALGAIHARLEDLAPWSRAAAAGVQVLAGVVVAAALWPPAAVAIAALALGVHLVARRTGGIARSA